MKKTFFTLVLLVIAVSVNAQSIFGKWESVDDKTGEKKSVIEIYEKDGKAYGKVFGIIDQSKRDGVCENCKGEKKDKPVLGMVIIEGLKQKGNEYKGGTILDPENGKEYKCKIWLDENDKNKLNVRGYVAFFYRTQQWVRVLE